MSISVPGGRAHQGGRSAGADAPDDDSPGRPARQREGTRFTAVLARSVVLMETSAQTERNLANTLQHLARHGESEAAARRLKLAEAANAGAQSAVERGERLLGLARNWAEHTDLVTLHKLLTHASAVLADLARTQQEIADTLASLASRDGSHLAADRLRAADQAIVHARRAREQAHALRQLAQAPAAKMRPE